MSKPAATKRSTVEFVLTFLALFFLLQYGIKIFFPAEPAVTAPLVLTATKDEYTEGHHPELTLKNNTDHELTLPDRCPQPLVDIAYEENGEMLDVMANETATPCTTPTTVAAHSSVKIDLGPWKYSLFGKLGTYKASLPIDASGAILSADQDSPVSTQFSLVEVGFFTKTFRAFVTKPLLNALVFIASYVPGHDLGWSIIILTILVKLILVVPNQHALKGQKKLQDIQPKMNELKAKYPNDPKKVQEETMRLWKEYKINPMQSCLPMALQFPFLIGLFYVIRDGGTLELSRHLLYGPYQDLAWQFDHMFFGLDLTQPSMLLLPPLLVVLQFIQMKLAFARANNKKKPAVVDVGAKKSWVPEMNQQTVMLYALPLMIGFFALKFPAAVSIYWATSTVFGIAQQWFVNRSKS